MRINAPEEVVELLDEIVAYFKNLLGNELVGVYLHGSIAMGCFNPASSDIDFIVVSKRKLTVELRQQTANFMLGINKKAPPKGFEMSIVTGDAVRHLEHPTPFEFHFSNEWIRKYQNGDIDLSQDKYDGDLAAHFTIIKERGICLCGMPIANLFPVIPKEYYLDAILSDNQESMDKIMAGPDGGECDIPVYGVLNAGRVIAYAEQGLILSKAEGGEWAVKNLPSIYSQLIRAALSKYENDEVTPKVDIELLKAYAMYVLNSLKQNSTVV